MGGCGSKVEPPIADVNPPGPAASRDQSVLTGQATDNDSVPQLTLSTDSATGGSELYNLCNKAKGSQDEAWNDVLKHLKSMSHRKRTKAAQEKAMGTFTPLAAACCRQPSLDVVKALVEAAPDTVTDIGNFGNTILHMALEGVASEDVILCLIEQGALGNTGDDAGLNNPSLSASGASAIVSQNGDASFDMLENGHGKTPLALALQHGYSLETVEALLEANGSDNAEAIIKNPDLEGCTPLHHAIQGNASLEVIQFLVEKAGKSIIEVKDSKNLTPFDIAQTLDASQDVKDYLGSKVSWQSIPWIATSSETRLRVPRTIDHGPGPTNSYRGHLQCGHGPEHWGITIEQLELIYKHPMLNSIQENDKDDEDIVLVESELTGMDSENGEQLSSKASRASKAQAPSTPTSYPSIRAVVDKIIKPATSETGLGFALTLNQDEPLLAQTVVSHAWDQPINELIDTLKDSGKEGPFWISAFSIYQNEEEEEDLMSTAMSAAASVVSGNVIMSGKDFQYGAFCTAMKEAKNMVSILTAACDYYSRLWCMYEMYVAKLLQVPVHIHTFNSQHETPGLASTISDVGVNQSEVPVQSKAAKCSSGQDETMVRRIILSSKGGFNAVDSAVEEARLLYLLNEPLPSRKDDSPWSPQELIRLRMDCIRAVDHFVIRLRGGKKGMKLNTFQFVTEEVLEPLSKEQRNEEVSNFEKGKNGKLMNNYLDWKDEVIDAFGFEKIQVDDYGKFQVQRQIVEKARVAFEPDDGGKDNGFNPLETVFGCCANTAIE